MDLQRMSDFPFLPIFCTLFSHFSKLRGLPLKGFRPTTLGDPDAVPLAVCGSQEIQTPGRVVSVWGAASTDLDRFKPCLAQKPMNFEGDFSTM
eukprot:5048702-Amphidinium_carterae.1